MNNAFKGEKNMKRKICNFKVVAREDESFDELCHRFKRMTKKSKIIQECRFRESFYPKPLRRKLRHEMKIKK